ncbi:MAG: NAD(P)-dependent oxidoreductase [Burkholderiaceae bacterium]
MAASLRILVTGGSGAVGRYVVDELLQAGHTVGVLDRVNPGNPDTRFHLADVLDLTAVTQAMGGYEAVVHVAGIPHPLNDPPKRVFDVNVNGTFNVLEAAAQTGIRRFVMTSSESTLGFAFATHPMAPQRIPVDESHPTRPQDAYGLSKVVCEQICQSYSARHGISTVCLRAPWIWLPEEAHRPFYRTLVADYGNWYKNLWAWIDARDCAQAHRLAVESEPVGQHAAMFVTAQDNWTGLPSRELLQRFYPPDTPVAPELHGPQSLISHAMATTRLGYRPGFTVQDTLG